MDDCVTIQGHYVPRDMDDEWVTACDTEQICCRDGKKLILPDGTQSTYTQMFMCAVGE